MKDFPSKLRAKRKAIEVNQGELAKALGVCHASVNHWEMGDATPTFFATDAIADYFECSVDELIGREGYNYTPPKKMREFKDILYDKMVKNNFTFKTLAEAIGVCHTAIRNWTSGKSYPDLKQLCAFADAFECSIDELMGRKPR